MVKQGRKRPARSRILEAADRLLYSEGIHAVGIERILDEAGVVKASLYSNFRSKDELIAEYLEGRSKQWQRFVESELAKSSAKPVDKILEIFDLLGRAFRHPDYRGCPFINAVAEFPDPKHPVQVITTKHRSWLRKLFHQLAKSSGIRKPEPLVSSLMLLYDGALVGALIDKDPNLIKNTHRAAERLIHSSLRLD